MPVALQLQSLLTTTLSLPPATSMPVALFWLTLLATFAHVQLSEIPARLSWQLLSPMYAIVHCWMLMPACAEPPEQSERVTANSLSYVELPLPMSRMPSKRPFLTTTLSMFTRDTPEP